MWQLQWCRAQKRALLILASARNVWQSRKRSLVVAQHHLNLQTSWKFSRLISLPACELFSYLYKNSFCKVLLKGEVLIFGSFAKPLGYFLSSCARVAKLSVTRVCFFIDWDKSFLLSWFFFFFEFEHVKFSFFLIKSCFKWLACRVISFSDKLYFTHSRLEHTTLWCDSNTRLYGLLN